VNEREQSAAPANIAVFLRACLRVIIKNSFLSNWIAVSSCNVENENGQVKSATQYGCDRDWWSVLEKPVVFPLMIGSGGAEVEHGVGIGFFPPSASDLEAFLDDVAMTAFNLA